MPLVGAFVFLAAITCTVSSVAVTVLCLRQRAVRGATWYAAASVCGALWGVSLAVRVLLNDLGPKLAIANAQFVVLQALGVFMATFMIAIAWPGLRHVWRLATALALPGVGVIAVSLARGGALPFLSRARLEGSPPFVLLLADPTPLALVLEAYSIAIVAIGLVALAPRLFDSPRLFRRQAALVLLGNAIPVVGFVFSAFLLPIHFSGTATFVLPLGQLFVVLGLLRYRLFDIVPVARELVLDHLDDPVVVLDASNRVLDFNPALAAWIEMPAHEAVGRPAEEVFGRWAGLVVGYRDVDGTTERIEVEGPDGNPRTFETRIQAIRDAEGMLLGRVIHSRDITDLVHAERELRRHRDQLEELVWDRTAELTQANAELQRQATERERLEDELQRAQKQEAMGRLAGGIAHHFNNLLVPILGFSEVGLQRIPAGAVGHEELQRIHQAAGQAADLARQMLAFSRRQVLEMRIHDFNTVVADLTPVLSGVVGERIDLDIRLAPQPLPVRADRGQLQQVVLNLVMHCRDAMREGGRLVLGLAAEAEASAPGHVVMTIADTATALDADARSRLFEPFYDGASGDPTGLGMAMVYGIVQQHEGAIEVAGGPGGNVYRLRLPRSATPAPALAGAPAVAARARGAGRPVVLVVEDDEGVRDLVTSVLRSEGYEVIEARNVADCARVLERGAAEIDLLLSDVVLPDGSGRDVERTLAAHWRDARVAFMSGYAGETVADFGPHDERTIVLQKPFTVDQLLAKVKAALA